MRTETGSCLRFSCWRDTSIRSRNIGWADVSRTPTPDSWLLTVDACWSWVQRRRWYSDVVSGGQRAESLSLIRRKRGKMISYWYWATTASSSFYFRTESRFAQLPSSSESIDSQISLFSFPFAGSKELWSRGRHLHKWSHRLIHLPKKSSSLLTPSSHPLHSYPSIFFFPSLSTGRRELSGRKYLFSTETCYTPQLMRVSTYGATTFRVDELRFCSRVFLPENAASIRLIQPSSLSSSFLLQAMDHRSLSFCDIFTLSENVPLSLLPFFQTARRKEVSLFSRESVSTVGSRKSFALFCTRGLIYPQHS